jgi:hypothetical protein
MTTKTSSKQNASKETIKCKMTTRIQIKCNAGFGNGLTIRGQGAGLSWDKGTPLKNLNDDEWVFETEDNFTEIEFKILINDTTFELGQNHIIKHGNYLKYRPKF